MGKQGMLTEPKIMFAILFWLTVHCNLIFLWQWRPYLSESLINACFALIVWKGVFRLSLIKGKFPNILRLILLISLGSIRALIKSSMMPTLEQYRPSILASLKFSKLTLRTVAPQFTGHCGIGMGFRLNLLVLAQWAAEKIFFAWQLFVVDVATRKVCGSVAWLEHKCKGFYLVLDICLFWNRNKLTAYIQSCVFREGKPIWRTHFHFQCLKIWDQATISNVGDVRLGSFSGSIVGASMADCGSKLVKRVKVPILVRKVKPTTSYDIKKVIA